MFEQLNDFYILTWQNTNNNFGDHINILYEFIFILEETILFKQLITLNYLIENFYVVLFSGLKIFLITKGS
jgi:hypothetical protein